MRYLLDTCTVSYFLKKYPNTISNMEIHDPTEIAISVMTIYEIEVGLRLNADKERKLRHLWERLLDKVNILDLDIEDSREAATIFAQLKKQGKIIGTYDLLIASTAISKNLICVTSNTREFSRVPGLVLEDWNI